MVAQAAPALCTSFSRRSSRATVHSKTRRPKPLRLRPDEAEREGRPGEGYEELKTDLDGVLKFSVQHRDIIRLWSTSTGDFMGKLLQKEVAGGIVHNTGPVGAEAEGKPVRTVSPARGPPSSRCSGRSRRGPGSSASPRSYQRLLRDRLPGEVGHRGEDPGHRTWPGRRAGRPGGQALRVVPADDPGGLGADPLLPLRRLLRGQQLGAHHRPWEREVLRKKKG